MNILGLSKDIPQVSKEEYEKIEEKENKKGK